MSTNPHVLTLMNKPTQQSTGWQLQWPISTATIAEGAAKPHNTNFYVHNFLPAWKQYHARKGQMLTITLVRRLT